MSDARVRFVEAVRAGVALDRGALEIARVAYPDLDPGPSLRQLDGLAGAIRDHVPDAAHPADAVPAIAAQLFGPLGFHGNRADYYDARNSFLNDVLERRTGIPITLAIVLIEVARRLGVAVEGVGFPGHFLVRATGPHGPRFFDPFFAGRELTDDALLERLREVAGGRDSGAVRLARVPPELLAPASTTDILVRMLRNLLRVWLDRPEHLLALEAVERILVLVPDAADEVRIRGQLYERLECFAAAREDYQRYLTLAPHAADAGEVRARLARLAHSGSTLH
jgi:regulator of sirC expression with transglutaminase-like and TPR domain